MVKKSDPASGNAVAAGSVITYTLTVTQQGLAAVPGALLDDDLTEVLDDAAYNDDLVASSGTASIDAATGMLAWRGDLAVGDVATITYSVTVGTGGDGVLVNTVTSPGCTTQCTTTHDRRPPPPAGLAITGGDIAVGGLVGAVLVIAVGVGLFVRGRRREGIDAS